MVTFPKVFSHCYYGPEEEAIPLSVQRDGTPQDPYKKSLLPARGVLAILGCTGFVFIYALKVNLGLAIVAMVDHTALALERDKVQVTVENSTQCGLEVATQELIDGPFKWNENVQGIILASYFYGYIFTQVPGGWLAEKISAKHVFGTGVLLNALLTLVTPLAAKLDYICLVVVRVLMGLSAAVTLPSMHVLISNWAPPQERSKIASLIYGGMTFGTLCVYPLTGFLASNINWESVFYIQGSLCLIWYMFWLFCIFDTPMHHPRISRKEREYIYSSMGVTNSNFYNKRQKTSMPWKSMWTSLPVWAIIIAHTCSNWGWYMLLIELPSYIRHILHLSMGFNGLFSSLPYFCMSVFTLIFASCLDILRLQQVLSTTTARKIATNIASIIPGISLVVLSYVGCDTTLALIVITIGVASIGAMYSGYLANHIDIAPNYCGTLMGVTNTFATLPGIIVPTFVGYVTNGNQTIEAWRLVFQTTCGIYFIGAIAYSLFGSGEVQEWAKPTNSSNSEEEQKLTTSTSKG